MILSDVLPRHRVIVVSVIALTGVITSLLLRNQAATEQENRIHTEFQHRAERNAYAAQGHLAVYPELLAQLSSVGSFNNPVYWTMLRNSFEHSTERHPTIAIMEWVPAVRHSNRERFERGNTRIQGRPIGILQRQSNGSLVPAPPAETYYPIQTAIPLEGNESVIGFDLSSAPTWPSLERARDTQNLVITPQFTLVQEKGPNDSLAVNLIMPVFIRESDSSPEEFRGFIQCILRIRDTLGELHRDSPDEALLIYYEDVSAASNERSVLYANLAGHEPPLSNSQTVELPINFDSSNPDFHFQNLSIGGREWRIISQINPAWAIAQRTLTPMVILGGGFSTTFLLSMLVNTLLLRTREIERTVKRRTSALEETRRMLEQDITQRVVAQKNLRESEALLRGVLDNSVSEVFVKDRHGRYILFNEEYRKSLGKKTEEIIGRTDSELFSPELAADFVAADLKVLETREVIRFETDFEFEGRRRVDIVQKYPILDSDGEIYAVGGIVTDISDRAEAEKVRQDYERKMQASQKMESLGVLAGGIAHDFNNVLATVLGQATLLRRQGNLGDKQDRQIGLIEVAARRASSLCEQMLTYAGKASHETELIDLNKIIKETTELLTASLPKNISLITEFTQPIGAINANSAQIRQVVMNLIINAADAIKPTIGSVTIRTSQLHYLADEFSAAVSPAGLAAGDYIVVEFTDTGTGIKPEILNRIFEPFFTTKFQGRGLGLSTVIGIVKNCGGGVTAVSHPAGGSTFTILLPKFTDPTPSEEPTSLLEGSNVWGGALVIDDEQPLRQLAVTLLELEGMTTFEAANGKEAINVYRSHQKEIQVILLDLTMPGMTGAETLAELRKINPDLRVIILSGYSAKDPKTHLDELEFDAFLQKPYELGDLLREISAVLPPR